MGALCYTLVESDSETQDFDCGNNSINELVSKSVYPSILKQAKTYKITIQGVRVGFISVSIGEISFEKSDAPIASYYEKNQKYGAVLIDFIAVDKKVHKQGIGKTSLKFIVQEAKELSAHWPVRVLVLDALRDVVDWYTKKGFSPIDAASLNKSSSSVLLYFDLMSEDEQTKLDQYVQSTINY